MTSAPDTIRVLHVDDEPDFAELTADFLGRQDNRLVVETATSVAEGLNQLSDENFDCIVSDYDMPERNGIEFLETVREDHPEFPFILFTGKGSEEIASEAISAGVTDYLQKEGGTGQYSVLANRIINAVSRRRTERDLRASEQRYRQLLEAAPVPILLYSESLEVIHTNEAAVDFLNADDRGQLIGKHATEFAHQDNQDHVQSRLAQIASNREPIPAAEAKIIAVDGSEKFAVASSIPGTYQGEPVVQTVAYDITQQKEQAGNYQAIFENTPEGIVLHDAADGSFVDMNTRYVEMFGYESKDEFLEAGFEAIHPNDPPYTLERAAEQVQKAITEGSHTFEWLAVRKDGSQFWAEVHLAPVELHGEERILAAVRDITERKEREDELIRQNERLEEFASIVSHDLRNPLSVAQGRLELAVESGDDEHLEAVDRAHDRMEALINDLLALARDGEKTLDPEPGNLQDIVERCWQNVDTADASLSIETDRIILTDKRRLQQLFENLFRNAVEHGGDEVSITVGTLPNGIYVEDDGPGIPEVDRGRVLVPGYSSSDSGTGFGLTIVQDVADDHEWSMGIAKGSDGGARFEFTDVEMSGSSD